MVAVIDYDAGNVKSVLKAFRALGQETCLTRDPEVIFGADHVVLPGVGNFGDAAHKLRAFGLEDVVSQGKAHPLVLPVIIMHLAGTVCILRTAEDCLRE